MGHHFHPGDQRQKCADRQAETVEDGQGIEQHVCGIKIDMSAHLRGICQDVGMGQRHPLGLALGARGEQDRRGVIGRGLGGDHARRQLAENRRQLIAQ